MGCEGAGGGLEASEGLEAVSSRTHWAGMEGWRRSVLERMRTRFQAITSARKCAPLENWLLFELGAMTAAVAAERTAARGLRILDLGDLPELSMDQLYEQVRRVEQMACGHTDYATKFPLYCAELVYSKEFPRP